jgi:NAD(P)-dependent dehydrogenase (short-subunit alcohol dehydrogenase family)
VAVSGRNEAKTAAAVERLRGLGGETEGFNFDVRDAEVVAAAWDRVAAKLGTIDVLVSGAAGNFPAEALAMSSNGFKAVVDIDLLGTFNVLRHGFAHLTRPGASVINVSAPQSTVPMRMQSHVCAAKAGVDMLTRALAMEWGPEGVRVNAVVPGPVADTEGMRRLAPSDDLRRLVERSVPLGRQATADDIAAAVLFLASPEAGYLTGAVIPVDGGWSLGGVSIAMDGLARHLAAEAADAG